MLSYGQIRTRLQSTFHMPCRSLVLSLIFSLPGTFSPSSHAANSTTPQEETKDAKAKCKQTKPPEDPLRLPFEVSFGTTQLFENWFGQNELSLPVSSATLMLAWSFHERVRAWVIFNLPLVPSQHLNSEGEARFSKNPPVALLGLSALLFKQKLRRDNELEIDLGVYGGKVLEPDGLYFPVFASRVSLIKKEDVTIYVGLSASIRVDTLGLIYGVGHRF